MKTRKKKTISRPMPRTATKKRSASAEKQQAEEIRKRNEKLLKWLHERMADESGYDEKAWPILEKLIKENPVHI